jgi:dTDP-4-amino-4,6-dideoxygalactose transaminase
MVYYPVPIHSQVAYAQYDFKNDDFPVTNMLSEKVLSLPMHTELTQEQLKYITDAIKCF